MMGNSRTVGLYFAILNPRDTNAKIKMYEKIIKIREEESTTSLKLKNKGFPKRTTFVSTSTKFKVF